MLETGQSAPPFSLPVTPDQTLALSDLRGKPVVLAFFPADWSPVCGDQMSLYNLVIDRQLPDLDDGEFKTLRCQLGEGVGDLAIDGILAQAANDHSDVAYFFRGNPLLDG